MQVLSNEAKSRRWELTAMRVEIDLDVWKVQTALYAATNMHWCRTLMKSQSCNEGPFLLSNSHAFHTLLKLCLLHSMLSKTKPQQAMTSAAQTLGGYECTCELLSKTW